MPRFAVALVALLGGALTARGAEPKLPAADAKYLDGLIADFLFDPTGAERVTLGPDAGRWEPRDGWLVRGPGGEGNRVFFTDGDQRPAPQGVTGVDFVTACAARYAPRPAKETADEADARAQCSAGVNDEADLTLAAWLHRLGHDALAAQALAAARRDAVHHLRIGTEWVLPGPRQLLRRKLAAVVARRLLSAYQCREDEAALRFAAKLFRLYPDVVRDGTEWYFWQAESVVADLERRKTAGTLGQKDRRLAPDELPADTTQRVKVLIDALGNTEEQNLPRTLSVTDSIYQDWRVRALVAIGDPAVPALIDAFESDNRRNRTTDHPAVRKFILSAIEQIMRVRIVGEFADEELLCRAGRSGHKVKAAAARFREHWHQFGKFPLDERMMKMLADPTPGDSVCRQAAWNLVSLNHESNRFWFPMLFGNRVVAKFSAPTAAEAMLAAWDRHLAAVAAGDEEPEGAWQCHRDYWCALVQLGDRRIAPALVRRAGAGHALLTRLKFAAAASRLGAPEPLDAIARELELGTLRARAPGPRPNPDRRSSHAESLGELGQLICELVAAETPAADRALWALAAPEHPHHRAALDLLIQNAKGWDDETELFHHPYWIGVARHALEDTALTGRTYTFYPSGLLYLGGRNFLDQEVPEGLRDPKRRRDRAAERVCDRLGMQLSRWVVGAAAFHPLRLDSEPALAGVIEAAGRYGRRYRRLTFAEAARLGLPRSYEYRHFIPDIKPLDRAATFADVAAGDAVFHLDGKGKPADVALPAWVTLKDKSGGLAVQAEIKPDGTIVYGVIGRHDLRTVPAAEVDQVEPVAKK
jgi:hypothetical protein